MLCENCGNHDANVKYTQIINGAKKEMNLCSECAEKLGITQNMNMEFDMGMNLPSFLGSFLEDYNSVLPSFTPTKQLKCADCGMSYDEFANNGMLGCASCYDIFEDRMDALLKNLQGSNRHIGRKGTLAKGKIEKPVVKKQEKEKDEKQEKLDQLKKNLKQAIKEERYEEAAKLRDEIKKIEG